MLIELVEKLMRHLSVVTLGFTIAVAITICCGGCEEKKLVNDTPLLPQTVVLTNRTNALHIWQFDEPVLSCEMDKKQCWLENKEFKIVPQFLPAPTPQPTYSSPDL